MLTDSTTWLMNGDCLELMKEIPSGSVDLVLCDLPYGTTQNKWDSVIPFSSLWIQYKRICTGAVVLTAAQPFTSALVMSNVKDFKYQWVWKKNRVTGHLLAKKAPLRQHEDVLVFCGSSVPYYPQGLEPFGRMSGGTNNQSQNWGNRKPKGITEFTNYPRTVINFDSEPRAVHPTQKPVALMEYLIRTYTHEGMTVLDNCMGSGTTGVACVNTGRKFIGIEKDEAYFEIAKTRILGTAPIPHIEPAVIAAPPNLAVTSLFA